MAGYDTFRDRLLASLNREFTPPGHLFSLEEWQEHRVTHELPLKVSDMRQVVAGAVATLQGLYVHMDLKRARRGVDPVGQLRVLGDRIDTHEQFDARTFHNRMLETFKTLGDVHTAYRLPEPYLSATAFLPFLLNAFVDGNRRRFIVTRLACKPGELGCDDFDRGVEVVSWNGTPIEQAVKRSTDFEEGSNTPHDLALGLQFMTVRWLGASFEPDSPWVVVGYTTPGDQRVRTCEFLWTVFVHRSGPRMVVADQAKALIFGPSRPTQQSVRALHVASQVVHAWRKRLFVPEAEDASATRKSLLEAANRLVDAFGGYIERKDLQEFTLANSELLTPGSPDEIPSLLPDFFQARIHKGSELIEKGWSPGSSVSLGAQERQTIGAKSFGYIGIRAFAIAQPENGLFKYELRRLLNLMPSDGLIIDVRDNPGGSARNAEESLQFLTSKTITPLPFRFLASTMTKSVALEGSRFEEYGPSIVTALGTGAAFSAGRPVTLPALANSAGQHYFGPVLLVTSATTYSAGDIFAAGFQDNGIGQILGTDETTGAGGANCWFYQEEIRPIFRVPSLPNGINMQVAVRQCVRIGDEYAGVPIEEIGITVPPDRRYRLQSRDLLESRPWGLLLRAAKELANQPSYELETALTASVRPGELTIMVTTSGMHRLDFYLDGRPTTSDVTDGKTSFSFPATGRIRLEIHGFTSTGGGDRLVARYVQVFNGMTELADRLESAPAQTPASGSVY